MASSDLYKSGNTSVIGVKAYVTENTTSGTSRRVRVQLAVYAKDYSGDRDASYSVKCSETGTNVSVPMYNGFVINGNEQVIFDQTFYVTVERGSSTASISLTFSASLYSPSAGTKSITGGISTLYLTAEPAAEASSISLGASSVQMGHNLLISIARDNASCTHTVTYIFGSATGTIATGAGTSCLWTVPDLSAKCPDAVSGECIIICKTYLSGTLLGTDQATVTLLVPDATINVTKLRKAGSRRNA